jgi:hypothetical protein
MTEAACKASVVVATRDRADRLRETLESLARLQLPDGGWELFVVDDGSTDETPRLLEEALEHPDLPLQVLRLEGRGKPTAVNAGIARCRGEVVALTDDDCLVAPDWLVRVVEEFDESPDVAGLGGRVELHDPAHGNVATRTSPDRRVLASARQLYGFVIGANMAFRRNVLLELGMLDPVFGPGAPVPSGSDIDIVYRAFRSGHQIVYTPRPVVYHNHGRVTDESLERVRRRYVVGRGGFYLRFALRGDRAILRMAGSEIWGCLRDLASGRRRSSLHPARVLTDLARGGWLWTRHGALGRTRRR